MDTIVRNARFTWNLFFILQLLIELRLWLNWLICFAKSDEMCDFGRALFGRRLIGNYWNEICFGGKVTWDVFVGNVWNKWDINFISKIMLIASIFLLNTSFSNDSIIFVLIYLVHANSLPQVHKNSQYFYFVQKCSHGTLIMIVELDKNDFSFLPLK